VIVGWVLARWPTILPGLTVSQAAAGHDTLVWVTVAVLGGGAILFPSLGFLFRLTLTGRFRAEEKQAPIEAASGQAAGARPGVLARVALGCLILGVGLLNAADAAWAHAIGVIFLLGFVLAGFGAVVSEGLA
jgi:cytochrome d ubiquinol oxidase subunit II